MSKSCIKCKHYEQPGISPVVFCKHPDALIGHDPVTGETGYFTCAEMRNQYKCGAEGALFEESKRSGLFKKLKYWFLN